jgi:hypothetical protein
MPSSDMGFLGIFHHAAKIADFLIYSSGNENVGGHELSCR